MPNSLYPKALQKFLSASLDMTTSAAIRVSGLSDTYTYNEAHEFYSSVSGVIFTATLTGMSVTNGIFDADDVTISSVSAGQTLNSLVIWRSTGTASTSPLIYYADTYSNGSSILTTLTGGQVIITWSDEPSKIFRI